MSTSIDDTLLDYYQRELSWLRNAGVDFAERYPKIAHRLGLNEYECPDPHVERLLESFAFLSAKLSRRLDDDYTQLSNALLEQLYPHAIRPMPSTAIACFTPAPAKGNLAEGYTIPRYTPLFVTTQEGETISFRTTSAQTLWPVRLSDARMLSAEEARGLTGLPQACAGLHLRLECQEPHRWEDLPISFLRLHLAGNPVTSASLYDLLAAHTLGPLRSEPLGFGSEERLLPDEDGVDPTGGLLLDYFACPEKFLFFDLSLPGPRPEGTVWELNLAFDREPDRPVTLQPNDLMLGCVPVINLFPRVSEPLRPDGTHSEYPLIADAYRQNSTEIWRIERIRAVRNGQNETITPYFSTGGTERTDGLFWHARRIEHPSDSSGSTILLSLVDGRFDPNRIDDISLTADLLCTNRHRAMHLPAGCPLSFESPGPVGLIHLLRTPTAPSEAALSGESRWRLVAQLSLGHVSLVEGEQARAHLQSLLELHAPRHDAAVRRQIDGIAALESERTVAHLGRDAWRGWRNGLDVTLTLTPENFAGSSPVLFAGVLAHFFVRYASVNRFIRTTLHLPNGRTITPWQPQIGAPLML